MRRLLEMSRVWSLCSFHILAKFLRFPVWCWRFTHSSLPVPHPLPVSAGPLLRVINWRGNLGAFAWLLVMKQTLLGTVMQQTYGAGEPGPKHPAKSNQSVMKHRRRLRNSSIMKATKTTPETLNLPITLPCATSLDPTAPRAQPELC